MCGQRTTFAVWAEIPYRHVRVPDLSVQSSVGDVTLAWGATFHKDLERRFTSSLAILEVHAPTGSPEKGTGLIVSLNGFSAGHEDLDVWKPPPPEADAGEANQEPAPAEAPAPPAN